MGLRDFDAWAHHPYYGGPWRPRRRATSARARSGSGDIDTPDFPGDLSLYGRKPLWITEYGCQTEAAGRHLRRQLDEASAVPSPGVRDRTREPAHRPLPSWFVLRDSTSPDSWQSGLITTDGRKEAGVRGVHPGLRAGCQLSTNLARSASAIPTVQRRSRRGGAGQLRDDLDVNHLGGRRSAGRSRRARAVRAPAAAQDDPARCRHRPDELGEPPDRGNRHPRLAQPGCRREEPVHVRLLVDPVSAIGARDRAQEDALCARRIEAHAHSSPVASATVPIESPASG